ncbi:MAG: hypothetical protein FGM24_08125 [Candidatus Kapabacteria bacterium]|nr:hypothetical protein [Candidatus Kapabacteria bacterium]
MHLVQAITIVLILQRLTELALSRRNAARAFQRGAVEHGREHYWMFVVLHVGWIIGLNLEWSLGSRELPSWWMPAAVLTVVLQFARYWVIRTLGEAWNTRIITWPEMKIVRSGPYQWVRHPNYIIVALELAIIPLMVGSVVTAVAATVVNAFILLLVRIPAETRALAQSAEGRSPVADRA